MSTVDVLAGAGDMLARATLAECERIIGRGLAAFLEVGDALARIRDEGLYREHHTTFEAYCRDRWGLGRRRAYQLIDAAAVCTIVHTAGLPTPENEAQARQLVPLRDNPGEMLAAWRSAQTRAEEDHRRLTARDVAEAVRERTGPTEPAPAGEPNPGPEEPADPAPVARPAEPARAEEPDRQPEVEAKSRPPAPVCGLPDPHPGGVGPWVVLVDSDRDWTRAVLGPYTAEGRVHAAATHLIEEHGFDCTIAELIPARTVMKGAVQALVAARDRRLWEPA